ncbi:acyclic terpene utilization AtuA family protein [Actinomadura sp. LD22]|uniref:Acyclic terpene utilization AtuA family protein n=1 Tax=Actinomadura physcomitrii TaxID=2650748 RepID=A0A6I4M7Y4_9ACTN|nr:acyclic terpene utilization AtuA family protein [Actinomadura physcomitrii]MVZ99850.1 acyclic terpene utilization AtuA family protein [Actinomadura physcomitrii]
MIRIGCGSAFERDRIDWPVRLADSGAVDHMAFDCLAERSMALNQLRKLEDPNAGYMQRLEKPAAGFDVRLPKIVEGFAPFVASGGTMVGNFGAANPEGAGAAVVDGLRAAGVSGVKVGVITGDDVMEQVVKQDLYLPEYDRRISEMTEKIVSANAYIGAEPVVEALRQGATFVLGGRLADPSPYVGPICFRNGWELDDWEKVGLATLAGHLLECGTHVTGGNFTDPPFNPVPDMMELGFPYAEVDDGRIVVSKTPGTGGLVSTKTVRLQIGYEIGDPAAYLTPDVTADFSQVAVRQVGEDRVEVTGASGRERPETLKVLVGLDLGWKVTVEMSYGGPGCVERAQFSAELLRARVEKALGDEILEWHTDLVGMSSLFGTAISRGYPAEVRMRVAARTASKAAAQTIFDEGDYLPISGPAAGGGRGAMTLARAIGVTPALLDRSNVPLHVEVLES